MSYTAAIAPWGGYLGQPSRTASATKTSRSLRPELEAFGFVVVNEIPIYNVTKRIRSLKDWGANWDGAGADAISPVTVERAITLIHQIYHVASLVASVVNMNWIDPNVTASPYGEVVFEWWSGQKKLTIYISENQSDYVKVWGADIDEEMEDGPLSNDRIAELLVWLGA